MKTVFQSHRQIIKSYFKNKYFLISSLIVVSGYFLVVPVSKLLIMPYFEHGGRIVSMLFIIFTSLISFYVLTIGWPGLLGTMLKSQFAHPRASLYPEFRMRHLFVAFMFFSFYQTLVFLTMAKLVSHYPSESYTVQVRLFMVLISLLFVSLGYFFHFGGIWISFIVLGLLVGYGNSFYRLFLDSQFITVFDAAIVGTIILLAWRLWKLREEMWEYRFDQTVLGAMNWVKSDASLSVTNSWQVPAWLDKLRQARARKIPSYPGSSNIIARAMHWLIPYGGPSSVLGVLWGTGIMAYIIFSSKGEQLVKDFSGINVPVFILPFLFWFSQSIFFRIWSADILLKPFSRKQLVLELGLAQLINIFRIFILFVLIFWIIPVFVYEPRLLWGSFLWKDVGIIFALGIFGAGLSSVEGRFFNTYAGQLIPVAMVTAIAYMLAEWLKHLATIQIFVVCCAMVIAGLILLRIAYYLWRNLKMGELKKRVMVNGAYLILLVFACYGFLTYRSLYSRVIDYPHYVIYVPAKLDYQAKHTLVVALSPKGNATDMIKAWKSTADNFKWIVLASKRFKNGIDWRPEVDIFKEIKTEVLDGRLSLPIDEKKVIASGISGGAWGSYDFAYIENDFISGLVLNTGMMNDCYMTCSDTWYPFNKFAVFLASPTDFRYKEMKLNREFLKIQGWDTKWLEFKGGHTFAPQTSYFEAAKWITEHWKNDDKKSGEKP